MAPPDDDAVILYTSGTTGRPKGAVLTHGNLTFNTMNQLAHADVLGTDTAFCIAPLFHATGLGQVSLPTFFKDGCVVTVAAFDPAAVLAAIASLRIASFSAVPTMLQMLCDHPEFAGTDLSSLRYIIYGGSKAAERVAIAWQQRGIVLLQGYGMTEASPGVFMAVPDGARERPTSIGHPHFFTDVTIASAPAQPGRELSGELLVRGLNVFRGYWNRPADTSAARHHRERRRGRARPPLGGSGPGLHRQQRRARLEPGHHPRGAAAQASRLQDPEVRPARGRPAEDRDRQNPQAGPAPAPGGDGR